jgi:Plasmid encoded RepA protein
VGKQDQLDPFAARAPCLLSHVRNRSFVGDAIVLSVESNLTDLRAIIRGSPDLRPRDLPTKCAREPVSTESCERASSESLLGANCCGATTAGLKSPRQLHRISSAAEAISNESAIDSGALGFMAKSLVQTTLPHRAHPGARYVRTDGNLTLSITDVGGAGLPYGSYPRLILIWMTTEAVRTASRELELGRSLSSFMAQLGLQASGGHWGTIPRFRNQTERLLGCAISARWSSEREGEINSSGKNLLVADEFSLWWTPQRLTQVQAKASTVLLSESFYQQIVEAPVPLDLRAVRALKKSPLTLDLYAWATRRVSYLSRPTLIPWHALRLSFGAGYANTPQGRSRFRDKVIDALRRVAAVYPQLRADIEERGVLLRPSATHIPKLLR